MVRVCRDPTITGFVEVEPEFQGQRALASDVGSSEAKTSHEWCECTIYHFKRIDSKSTIYVDALIEWGQVSLGRLKLTEEYVKTSGSRAVNRWKREKKRLCCGSFFLPLPRGIRNVCADVSISATSGSCQEILAWGGVGEAEIVKKPLFQTFRLTSTG